MKDSTVSMSKALAIILMVLAHTRFSSLGNEVINLFHMPLFFFFSGYCFKDTYLKDFRKYSVKRIRGIWFPYVKWGGLFLLLHNLFYIMNFYGPNIYNAGEFSCIYTIKTLVVNMFCMCARLTNHDELLGGYWFLHTLFFASFISYVLMRFVRNHVVALLISLCITLILYYFSLDIPFFKVGGREVFASSFIISGKLCNCRKYKALIIKFRLTLIFSSFLLLIGGSQYLCCSMLSITSEKIMPYFFTALICTISVHSVMVYINSMGKPKINTILCYVGDNTLDILTWHFLIFKMVSYFLILSYGLSFNMISSFPVIEQYSKNGFWILYFCAGCILPLVGGICNFAASKKC